MICRTKGSTESITPRHICIRLGTCTMHVPLGLTKFGDSNYIKKWLTAQID